MLCRDTAALYAALKQTPDLCGTISLKGDRIHWTFPSGLIIEAWTGCEDDRDTYISIGPGTFHEHPDAEDMYDALCSLGRRGSLVVLRQSLLGTISELLYVGPASEYRPPRLRSPFFRRAKAYLQE